MILRYNIGDNALCFSASIEASSSLISCRSFADVLRLVACCFLVPIHSFLLYFVHHVLFIGFACCACVADAGVLDALELAHTLLVELLSHEVSLGFLSLGKNTESVVIFHRNIHMPIMQSRLASTRGGWVGPGTRQPEKRLPRI